MLTKNTITDDRDEDLSTRYYKYVEMQNNFFLKTNKYVCENTIVVRSHGACGFEIPRQLFTSISKNFPYNLTTIMKTTSRKEERKKKTLSLSLECKTERYEISRENNDQRLNNLEMYK